mmetsp:Transcript_86566/g.176666  ORF Transcript_86566/g.176666 Transcript_86566/m.176666 type:complete len:206 (-) Transcript_86566:7-624(-)
MLLARRLLFPSFLVLARLGFCLNCLTLSNQQPLLELLRIEGLHLRCGLLGFFLLLRFRWRLLLLLGHGLGHGGHTRHAGHHSHHRIHHHGGRHHWHHRHHHAATGTAHATAWAAHAATTAHATAGTAHHAAARAAIGHTTITRAAASAASAASTAGIAHAAASALSIHLQDLSVSWPRSPRSIGRRLRHLGQVGLRPKTHLLSHA